MKWKRPSEMLRKALEGANQLSSNEAEHQLCKDYYDGHQETAALRAWRDERGIHGHNINLYQQHIDAIVGNEHQTQTDWMCVADDDSGEDVADATNVLINEMARLADVNSHCSDAFLPMANAGLGWLYFGENEDCMGYEYDCHSIPSTEIIHDKRSRRLDLEDCQFIVRRRYLDQDQVKALFPKHEKLIDVTFTRAGNWGPIQGGSTMHNGARWAGLEYSKYSHFLHQDTGRHTVGVFDMYYRAYEKRDILYMEGLETRTEYDPENPVHVESVLDGSGQVKRKRISVMRRAWFIGPHLVEDELSPHPHRMFPYVMCRAKMEEKSHAIYGVGRTMIAAQDSYNMALTQLHALMEKVTVIIKGNALAGTDQTVEDVQKEAHKGDGIIEISKAGDIELIHHYEHIRHLTSIMDIARENMRAASGVNNAFTGQEHAQKSGIAMQTSVEQSHVVLAEINANYQFARRMVGRLMLAYAIDKYGDQQMDVDIKSESQQVKKTVTLNEKDDNGHISNSLTMARMQVAMQDVQTSAGYKAQNMLMLRETAGTAPEAIQPSLFIAMLESSNLPNRHELIADMKRALGQGVDEQQQEQMMEQQAQAAADEAEMVKQERLAEIRLTNAKAAEAEAKARQLENPGEDQQVMSDQKADAANDAEMQQKQAKVAQLREAIANRAVA